MRLLLKISAFFFLSLYSVTEGVKSFRYLNETTVFESNVPDVEKGICEDGIEEDDKLYLSVNSPLFSNVVLMNENRANEINSLTSTFLNVAIPPPEFL